MSAELDRKLLDLELETEVWLGEERVPLQSLLELQQGGTLPLKRDPDEPVELVINGSTVATGELVVLEGRFAFRVATRSAEEIAKLQPEEPPTPEAEEAEAKEEEVKEDS